MKLQNWFALLTLVISSISRADTCSLDSFNSCPLGGTVVDGGAVVRVWAAGSEFVSVKGDFSKAPIALAPEGKSGIFSAPLPDAHSGDKYIFSVTTSVSSASRSISADRLDPESRVLSADEAAAVFVDPDDFSWPAEVFNRPALSSAVIYEMHVGSFNPPARGPWGTYNSAASRLDDLASLGVNFIELLPLQQSATLFDWGYGVSLPNTLEPSYGSPNELRQLVVEAHRRGIGVLLDVVHNHYSQNSALDCWAEDCQSDSGSYFYSKEHGETQWGPRPNYAQTEVRDLIKAGINRWIDEYHVDGFRWDAVPYLTKYIDWNPSTQVETTNGLNPDGVSLIQEINQLSHGSKGLISIAEDFEADPTITQPVGNGGLGFDAHWTGFFPVVQAITEKNLNQIDIVEVARALDGSSDRVIYTESHDEVGHPPRQIRIPARIDAQDPGSLIARKRSLLGAVFVMTSPGVPMIFQGQEFLESESFAFPHGTLLDWKKLSDYEGIWTSYRDLIALRKGTPTSGASSSGALTGSGIDVYHQNNSAKVIAYHRWDQANGGDVVVIANLGDQSFTNYQVGLPSAGNWSVLFASDDKKYSADFGGSPSQRIYHSQAIDYDGFNTSTRVELAPFSAIILGAVCEIARKKMCDFFSFPRISCG